MNFKKILIFSAALFFIYETPAFSQKDSIEVFLIDSYVTPELPHTFVLSFFTSINVKSKVLIDGKYEYTVSDKYKETHQIQIDISKLKFKTKSVPFVITVEDSLGNKYTSEVYDFDLPQEIKVKDESNFLLLVLFGATVFLVPNPAYVSANNKSYFSLTKEIPLISLRKQGFTYPMGYFSVEYSHIFNSPIENFLRVGYKHIIETPVFQYISPGINGTTNFNGYNGISPEISLGLFRIVNTFIVYTRYRYNFKPGDSSRDFHEISIGLYTNFFSLYL